MAPRQLPPVALLRQLLDYDPVSGVLTWRPRPEVHYWDRSWNTKFAGKVAGYHGSNGYIRMGLQGRTTLAHRVCWAIHHGAWPTGEVDHIDGDRTRNAIANLRDVSVTVNRRNTRRRSDNTSGAVGVRWDKRARKWTATINIGTFSSFDEAVAARRAAEQMLGFHANHGRVPHAVPTTPAARSRHPAALPRLRSRDRGTIVA